MVSNHIYHASRSYRGRGACLLENSIDVQTCIVTADSTQYDAVHHYENSDKEYVDIDPHNPNITGLVAKTNIERLIDFNDDLSNIKIINPKMVQRVATQFISELKGS